MLAALSFAISAHAQQAPVTTRFKEGILRGDRNIGTGRLSIETLRPTHFAGKYYVVLQFDRLPDPQEKKELADLNIRLFDYIPQHSFLAEVDTGFSPADLRRYAVE